MKFSFLIILFNLLIAPANAFVRTDTVKTVTDTCYKPFSVTFDAASNRLINGISGVQRQLYVSPGFTYQAEKGFFTGISSYKYGRSRHLIDEIDFNIGYFRNLGKGFTTSISYTRFIYNRDLTNLLQYGLKNNLNFYLKYRHKGFSTKIFGDYYSGIFKDYSITYNIMYEFVIDSKRFKEDEFITIGLKPVLIASTQNIYEEYFNRLKKRNLRLPISSDNLEYYTRMGFTNLSFSIPFTYYRGNYTWYMQGQLNYNLRQPTQRLGTLSEVSYLNTLFSLGVSYDF